MRRSSVLVALFAIVALAFPCTAAAQQPGRGGIQPDRPCWPDCGGDLLPPDISLDTPGPFTVRSPLLKIGFCDNISLSAGTRWVKVNGNEIGDLSWQSPAPDYVDCDPLTVTARSQSSSAVLSPGYNSIEAHICDTANNCTTETYSIYYDDKPTPTLSLAPHRDDLVDYARCAMACFAATQSFTTVPYFTLNTPRSVTLVYNSDVARPRPFIHVDLTHGGDANNLPSYFYLKLQRTGGAWITFLNGEQELRFTAPSVGPLRLSGQFDAMDNSMGDTRAYAMTAVIGADYNGTRRETTAATRIIVVNESNSAIGRGWMVAGVQRMYWTGDSILVTEGDGSATYFRKSGGNYLSPAGDFTRLVSGGPDYGAYWTRYYPDSTRIAFNSGGLAFSIRDRFGNVTQIVHDGYSRPWKIQDPTHSQFNVREITLVYDGNGLDYIDDAFGRRTQVTVDGSRDLTTITDLDGVSTSFTYSGGRLATLTDRVGAVTTLGMGSLSWKLTSVSHGVVSVYGEGMVEVYDSLIPWQLLSTPYVSTQSIYFNSVAAASVMGTYRDPGGHVSAFTVNSLGQPLRAGAPLGDTVTVTYNAAGQPTYVVDRLGVTSSFSYDASGFMTYSTVGGVISQARNGGWAQADSVWGHTAGRRFFLNSTSGRVDSARVGGTGQHDTLQTKVRYTYDARGRVLTAHDNMGHLLERHWFDGAEGGLSKDSVASGTVTTYGYDGYGRQTSVVTTGLPTRTLEYDAINRVIRSWDGVNQNPTRYFYGSSLTGGIVSDSVMDPRGQLYIFTRNAVGWLIRRTDPAGAWDTMEYDRDGVVRRTTNRRAQVISMTYDALHRVTSRSGDGITTATFGYSGDGRRDTVTTGGVSEEIAYLNARLQADSVRTTLQPSGRGYVQHYRYRVEGWVDSAWVTGDVGTARRRYRWRPNLGVMDTLAFGNGGWTTFRYNPDLQAEVTRFSGSDSIVRRFTDKHLGGSLTSRGFSGLYRYDRHGRVTAEVDSLRALMTRWFGYDGLSRLDTTRFGWSSGCSWDGKYGYTCSASGEDSTHLLWHDEVGNRLDHGGSYDTGNRVTGFDGCGYGTDAAGNVTTRSSCGAESATFTWGGDGLLTSYTVGGTTVGFAYDAMGRLVRKDVGGSPQRYYLWDGWTLVAELGASGTSLVAEYMYYPGLDNLYALKVGDWVYFAHTDALGSVRALTGSAGQVRRTYDYDEWGRLLPTSGDSLPFNNADRARFKGALWMGPELDLYYMRNRWYEPRTGRFLSEDPIGLEGGINQYAFGGGDPVNRADPSGLMMDRPDNTGGHLCWSDLCQAAWNPGGDWNGDGEDDWAAFTLYSWGRQLWIRVHGGTSAQWSRIWDARRLLGAAARAAFDEVTYFGRIRTMTPDAYEQFEDSTVAALGLPSWTIAQAITSRGIGTAGAQLITIDPAQLRFARNLDLGFLVAHELYHFAYAQQHMRGLGSEANADCFARWSLGWRPTATWCR